MPELVVSNPNIMIDASIDRRQAGRAGGHSRNVLHLDEAHAKLVERLRQVRREIDELVCSSTWAEDCLYRGATYEPDFECGCPVCRNFFPNRRHPRNVRESLYSQDCQIEGDEDPEFAEDFATLRSDRDRIGSVVIGRSVLRLDDRKL